MADPIDLAIAATQQPQLAGVQMSSGRPFAIPADITDLELAEMATWCATQVLHRLKLKAPKLSIVTPNGAPLA